MKIGKRFIIIFVITLIFNAASNRAQAQQPVSRAVSATQTFAVAGEMDLSKHLAQVWRGKPRNFSLMPDSSYKPAGPPLSIATPAAAANFAVFGSGTIGRLTKWTGFTGNNWLLGDTTIFESKTGLVGIGTDTPASKLTVAGTIESTTGGFKFPDGTLQTTAGIAPANVVRSLNGLKGDLQLAAGTNITITPGGSTLTVAAPNALTAVAHDQTLTGDGTQASPLGIASPLEVRDLDNPARQPVQLRGTCNMTNGQVLCPTAPITYLVPQGKRLVIEYASMQANLQEGQSVSMFIQIEIPAAALLGKLFLPLSAPAHDGVFAGGPFTSVGQTVRMYANPGLTVVVNGVRNNGTGTASYDVSIAGHLVDLP
jgi:hypothetical protein